MAGAKTKGLGFGQNFDFPLGGHWFSLSTVEPRISNEVNPGRDGQNPLFRFPRFRATKLGGSWSRGSFSGAQLDLVLSFSQAITLHLWISWPSSFASISAHAQGSRKGPLVVHPRSVRVAQLVFLCTVSSQVARSLCSDELSGQPACSLSRDWSSSLATFQYRSELIQSTPACAQGCS